MEDGLGEGKMGNGGVKSGIDVFLCSKKKRKEKWDWIWDGFISMRNEKKWKVVKS